MEYKLRYYQEEAVKEGVDFFNSKTRDREIQILPTGCHEAGAKLTMFDGTLKQVEDLVVGDELMGRNSRKMTIQRLHSGFGRMIEITPATHDSFRVNEDHIMSLIDTRIGCFVEMTAKEFLLSHNSSLKMYKPCKLQINDEEINIESKFPKIRIKGNYYYTYICYVKYSDDDAYYGFELDGDHLYLDLNKFVHHNSGKSLVIANIAKEIGKTLVFQPRKEILEQNYEKYVSYGNYASVYSASMNRKELSDVVFATIGSVMSNQEAFHDYKNIIHDECHFGTNPKGSMFADFYDRDDIKILGLTATPYTLSVDGFGGAQLKFLTRTKPRIFNAVNYLVQIQELLKQGFLNKVEYYPLGVIDSSKLVLNSNGTDYTDSSVKKYYDHIGFNFKLHEIVQRVLNAGREKVLVFTRFIYEAEYLCEKIQGAAIVTGQTSKKERSEIIGKFKTGEIPVVVNVNVLSIGFDYPELDTVIMGKDTLSLALYYQIVGREIRTVKGKRPSWFIDLGNSYMRFGKVEDLHIGLSGRSKWAVYGKVPKVINGKKTTVPKQLTNVYYEDKRENVQGLLFNG